MESKGLNITSFYQNQTILDAINNLLLHYKLKGKVSDTGISLDTLANAKELVLAFGDRLAPLVQKVEQHDEEPLVGTDIRLRNFAKSFVEAKGKKGRYSSSLFESNLSTLRSLLQDGSKSNPAEIINALSELRLLFEEQVSNDSKSIVGDI
ncbi:hypothetical protein [Puia dinghuensis]|uniref:Uncharacterized protein n=1 Tax=Puia dinghuensis TaxID=1792502 RepID=A0A8J2UBG3_9BACT|nr:hypothetical protein [Puia dinghuensis]GGA92385.1 hypothetical protein GCM10011511_14720 [Puia dinghuensis]